MHPIQLPNFTTDELKGITDDLALRLQMVRELAGVPLVVTSGLRDGNPNSEHSTGEGVDVSDNSNGDDISSSFRYKVVRAAILLGFTRIGVYDRHVHLGISSTHPQEVMWWAKSS
jgi:hypothetical protein